MTSGEGSEEGDEERWSAVRYADGPSGSGLSVLSVVLKCGAVCSCVRRQPFRTIMGRRGGARGEEEAACEGCSAGNHDCVKES